MFNILKVFHLTHVVSDLRIVDQWYDEIFSPTRFLHGPVKIAGRNASLIAIGDLVVEPMEPLRDPDLPNQSVRRFLDRHGDHLHAIAFYVDDVPAISLHLEKHGIRMWDITGTPVKPPNEQFAIWTHPDQTHGQLEFAIIEPFTIDPRLQPAWSNDFWREHHPLGIERTSHITAVVKDIDLAKRFYRDVLNSKPVSENETRHKRSAFLSVGEDTIVELAQPLSSDCAEARDLERHGDGFFGVTFKTRNLSTAADFLRSKQMNPEPGGPNVIQLRRETAFGMEVSFTDQPLVNDPRI